MTQPSNAPSDAYRSHHDVEAPQVDATAFRQGWRVHGRLQGLADDGLIDNQQLEAAQTWGRWMERTSGPVVSQWKLRVDGGTRGAERIVQARVLDAAARLRGCAVALGPERMALLYAVVVEDLSWRGLGRRLGLSCTTTKKRAVAAIAALERFLAR